MTSHKGSIVAARLPFACRSALCKAFCEMLTSRYLPQVALLQKENKSVSNHLKAAQSARAAAQRAASQLREENTALAESQDKATVRPVWRIGNQFGDEGRAKRRLVETVTVWQCCCVSL